MNEDSYFGHKITEGRSRFSDHCSKIKLMRISHIKINTVRSLLYNPDQMELFVLKVGFVKMCRAMDIDPE